MFKPIKRTVAICDLLGIEHLERHKGYLLNKLNFLENPYLITSQDTFVGVVDDIKETFEDAQEEIKEKLSKLDEIEIERLNEAIDTFFEDCYYSTVAMSVCAVENRLLKLMTKVCPQEKEQLEGLPLGRLIGRYLDDKVKYQYVVPKKHGPLLNLCN